MSPKELQQTLSEFYGTNEYYKHWTGSLVYTDGIHFLQENAECYWLLDAIASYQPKCKKDPMLKDMQFWTLTVINNEAKLTCKRDSNDTAFVQNIEYTDFPLKEINIWVENGVAYLPSER